MCVRALAAVTVVSLPDKEGVRSVLLEPFRGEIGLLEVELIPEDSLDELFVHCHVVETEKRVSQTLVRVMV